jgi:hypothetical protein
MKLPSRFDMTITREDFCRLLPAAVNHVPFAEIDGAYVHEDGARGWRICLAALPQLKIGLIRLERHHVEFKFSGYSPKEIEAFMSRFEMYFRRGGG